ncbi:MAG: hypothetical protein SNJ68_12970 [Cyanobacteriota bacterium]
MSVNVSECQVASVSLACLATVELSRCHCFFTDPLRILSTAALVTGLPEGQALSVIV